MEKPTKFEIKGLFGTRDIEIPIEGDSLILVGPNGIGKSCVTNIFYFFVSRQWARLSEYDFFEVAIWFGRDEVRAARSDITGLSHYDKLVTQFPPSSRIPATVDKLRSAGLLDSFLSGRKIRAAVLDKIVDTLDISTDEIRHLQINILRRLSAISEDDIFSTPRADVERKITQKLPGRTLYLPTYRRIEKDINDIFPDLEERLRSPTRLSDNFTFSRSSKHYIDLVSFGMEDVRRNIESKVRFLRDYSLEKFNDMSALYLKDVIKGTADRYSPGQISKLSESELSVILGRVSEQILSPEDKDLLRKKILDLKCKKKSQIEGNDLYLAHYFSRLMTASADISKQETEISAFVDVCNAYLNPSKHIVYDDTKFAVTIIDDRGREIDLSVLSSGEKQVVSLFSHLYLDEADDQIVIIDEPELSLSVPWQKRFLTDILDSTHCKFILSVTHSPFIYQNRLKSTAIDLRRRIIDR